MDTKILYYLLVAAILCSVSTGQAVLPMDVKISVDITRSHAHKGDNITLTCRVNDLGEGFVYLFKRIIDLAEGDNTELIATDTALLPPYINLPRYSIKRFESDHTTVYMLDIHGVTVEDSGHLGCSFGELAQNIYDVTQFTVFQNPQSVTFDTYSEEGAILVKEGVESPLTCMVKDASPVPDVFIKMGEHDVTSDFQSELFMHMHCAGGITTNCPLHYTYDVNTSSRTGSFLATYKDHRTTVKCHAELPGSGVSSVVASLPLLVEYAPKFACDDVQHAVLGARGVRVKCTVTAYPHYDNSTYVWTFMDGQWQKSLTHYLETGIGISQGNYHTGSNRINEDDVEVMLILGTVSEDSFKDYTLFAGNSIGNNTITITLKEGMSGEENTGGASALAHGVSSWIVSLATILVIVACAH